MKLATAFDQGSIGSKLNYVIESTIPTIDFPIISKGETWVRVNDLLIREIDSKFKVTRKGMELATFAKKSWAVAYAVAFCQSNFKICFTLKNYNKRIEKYLEDMDLYNYRIEQAQEAGDRCRENIMSDRLSRTASEYSLIIDEVSPLIKSQSVV